MKKFKIILTLLAIFSIFGFFACKQASDSVSEAGLTAIPKFKITFDSNGGSAIEPVEVEKGKTVLKPEDPTKQNENFLGWFTDKECIDGNEWNFDTPITEEKTLYAKWSTTHAKVEFDTAGGTKIERVIVKLNDPVDKPDTEPTKEEHTFFGWYKEKEFTTEYDFTTLITKNITIYAKFVHNDNVCTITFDSRDGSAVDPIKVILNTKATEPTPAPIRANYVFKGWYKEAECTTEWKFATDTVKGDMTLYAKWEGEPRTITFDSRDGSVVDPITVPYDTKATAPPAPTKTGYTFEGWYKDSGFAEKWNFTTDKVTKNITLYAKWEVNTYRVSFDAQGGSPVPPVQSVKYDKQVTEPPAPTKKGSTFKGWFTFDDVEWDFETAVTENITLKAKWEINTYKVTIDFMNGTPKEEQNIEYNQKAVAPATPVKIGYSFGGWFKLTGEAWSFDTPITEDVDICAKWLELKFTEMYLNFDINDGQLYIEISGENFDESTLKHVSLVYDTTPVEPIEIKDSKHLRVPYPELTKQVTFKFTYNDEEKFTLTGYVIIVDSDGTLTKYSPTPRGELILPEGIKKINNDLFKDNSLWGSKDITKVVFPESLEEIGESAFENCRGLETIVFNKNLEKIGAKAFYKNESLKSIELPENLISIGDSAFENCRGLEIIVFSKNLEKIGAKAFYKNESLKSIELPENLISIGDSAFENCRGLETIVFNKNLEVIGEKAFYIYNPMLNTPDNKLIKIYGNKMSTVGINAFNNKGAFNLKKPITFEIYNVSDEEFENVKTLITDNCKELKDPTIEHK